MNFKLKELFSKEVDCLFPSLFPFRGTGVRIAVCGLGVAGLHDTFRCLLKLYLNRKNNKHWHHQLMATVEKKLFIGKLLGVFKHKDDSSSIAKSPKTGVESLPPPKSPTTKTTLPDPIPVLKVRTKTEVLFFPDSGIPCSAYYHSSTGCSKGDDCPFLHDETAYLRLIRILEAAKKSIDVCVFCLTCGDLGSTLIAKSREGIRVRVVTDSEQITVSGSQIGRLRKEGILVRHDTSSYLMHHKFAVIDEEQLINGSFNWTRTAITGNHENLVISRDENMVKPFVVQFAFLWKSFHPDKQTGFSQKPVRKPW